MQKAKIFKLKRTSHRQTRIVYNWDALMLYPAGLLAITIPKRLRIGTLRAVRGGEHYLAHDRTNEVPEKPGVGIWNTKCTERAWMVVCHFFQTGFT